MNTSYAKILLTHDGSKLASLAIPHTISLVKTYDAELIVLQVIDAAITIVPAIATTPSAYGTKEILADIAKRERKAAKIVMKNIQEQLDVAGITKVTISIEEGDPREEIIKTAKRHNCDLIVMSTHGRTGLKRVFLGSIAEDVARNAPCPVLLVRPIAVLEKKFDFV